MKRYRVIRGERMYLIVDMGLVRPAIILEVRTKKEVRDFLKLLKD